MKLPGWLRGFWEHSTSDSKSQRILGFLLLNLGFMFVELLVGLLSNSLGLVSDAGHMLFDCAALAIGLFAAYASKWSANEKYTYGYSRVEVISGFVNGVFLIFIALAVFTESLHRLNEPPEVHSGHLIWTSAVGLIINMIGLVFFHDFSHGGGHGHDCSHAHGVSQSQGTACHGHSHDHSVTPMHNHGDSHSHSHGDGYNHNHCSVFEARGSDHSSQESDEHSSGAEHLLSVGPSTSNSFISQSSFDGDAGHTSVKQTGASSTDQNMRGIFLHVLADALGSIGVVISSILIRYFGWSIADPLCSLMISVLILLSVVPLLQDTAWILLQHIPTRGQGSKPAAIYTFLSDVRNLKGVVNTSSFHLWTLGGNEHVATLHVSVDAATIKGYETQNDSYDMKNDSGKSHVTWSQFELLRSIEDMLRSRFEVTESTIQISLASDLEHIPQTQGEIVLNSNTNVKHTSNTAKLRARHGNNSMQSHLPIMV